LEIKLANENRDEVKNELLLAIRMKEGFRDVDRNWGMALLTIAAGVLAITAIMVIPDFPQNIPPTL
jgi:hypothetical protein